MKIMNIEGMSIHNQMESIDSDLDQSERFNDRINYMVGCYYQS